MVKRNWKKWLADKKKELAEEREAEGNRGGAENYRMAHDALRELVGT